MKVFIYNQQNIWKEELIDAFKELGYETQVAFPASEVLFQEYIQKFEPDILLTLGCPVKYDDKVLEYIGRNKQDRSYKYIHWDTEGMKNITVTNKLIEKGQPDIVLTIGEDVRMRMKNQGIESYILPYGVNLHIHHPLENQDAYKGSYSLIATNYRPLAEDFRKKTFRTLVEPLLDRGIPVEARGYGWQTQEELIKKGLKVYGYCAYHEINKIYNGAWVNLILQNYDDAITKRTYEVLGAGGFMITYDSVAIRQNFTSGKELLVSSSPKETLEIISYYQTHLDEYWQVRKAAAERAREFTYTRRLKEVLEEIGLLKEMK